MALTKYKRTVIFHPSYATGYLCDKYHKKAGPTCNTNISYSCLGYALQSQYEIRAFHGVSDRVEIFSTYKWSKNMSLMKYENIEIDDFTEKITEGGVVHTLYEGTFQGVSWNPHYVWLHYYAINDNSSSRYLVWLRNLAPARGVIFKRDCVMVGKELREKINSWL